MKEDILFEEVQGASNMQFHNFSKTSAAIFAVALGFNLYKQEGIRTTLTSGLLVGLLLFLLAAVFTSFKMVTQIKEDGIYVRYAPFQPYFTHYSWNNIEEVYIRTYNPLTEYYGWGIKQGPMGKAYTISGNTGVQLLLKNNTQVLIGTQKSEEMTKVLKALEAYHKL